MPGSTKAAATRASIIEAANTVVRRHGPSALTLEGVASEAGVSKGGLLYHFSGKEALITGMLEHALTEFEKDVDVLAGEHTGRPGDWLRAFVKVTFDARPDHDPSASILAAAAINPSLLEPVGDFFERWQRRATDDGCDEVSVSVIRLAADGVWFGDMFGAAPPTGDHRSRVLKRLLDLVDAAVAEAQGKVR